MTRVSFFTCVGNLLVSAGVLLVSVIAGWLWPATGGRLVLAASLPAAPVQYDSLINEWQHLNPHLPSFQYEPHTVWNI